MPMLELIAAPAVCVPYAQAQQELTDKFGEVPFGAGVTPDGRLVLGTLNADGSVELWVMGQQPPVMLTVATHAGVES